MAEYEGGFRLIQFDIPNKCAIDKDPGHSVWRNDLKARIYDYAVDTQGGITIGKQNFYYNFIYWTL